MRHIIGLLVTVLALSACASSVGDGELLSAGTCSPPCMWGITPGVTTEAGAIQAFKDHGVYVFCTTYDPAAGASYRGVECNNVSFQTSKDTDIVAQIGLKPETPIALKDVIARYGDPDTVQPITCCFAEQYNKTHVFFFFDKYNMMLEAPDQDGFGYTAAADTQIVSVFYGDETTFKAWLATDASHLAPWTGYTVYTDPNPLY